MELTYLSRIGLGGALSKQSSTLGTPEEAMLAAAAKMTGKPVTSSPKHKAETSPGKASPKAKAKATPKAVPTAKTEDGKDEKGEAKNFLQEIIEESLKPGGRCHGRAKGDIIRTRFPPEPNGYLHVGHAKSICLNFGLAQQYGGRTNLRFDDTNPVAEKTEYVESIKEDVKWLGFDWDEVHFTSSNFDKLYEWAEYLIEKGDAYVDSQPIDEMRKNRGNVTTPGTDSPFRTRSVKENMKLFREMKAGKHAQGTHILRAKCDMKSNNMIMRDPPIYRIMHKPHHRTGDKWCIYPLYDFAHGQVDAMEGITHSICTLEFKDHNELYQWFTSHLPIDFPPIQYEFSRLNLVNAVMSKRKLKQLVDAKMVDGWDDPRMPTISGFRRRGVTPKALREFCGKIGVTTSISWVQTDVLEDVVRNDLEPQCHRRFAVLNPLKVTIESYPKDKVEEFESENHPTLEGAGKRKIKFTREIFIEHEDFAEVPPTKFLRLRPGGPIKLRNSYIICFKEAKKDAKGEITEIICTHEENSLETVTASDGQKCKVIHWVDAKHCIKPNVRLYDYLLKTDDSAAPEEAENEDEEGAAAASDAWLQNINPKSVINLTNAVCEESLKDAKPMERFQFERNGFFVIDKYSKPGNPTINRILGLKESSDNPTSTHNAAADARREMQAKQAAEKDAKKNLDPADMFRTANEFFPSGPKEFSKFDADGMPTHDASGAPLAKSKIKNLKKDWDKQKKAFGKN